MFVLRTAREIAAEVLGRSLDDVNPQTSLGPATAEVLDELYRRVVTLLDREQVIDDAGGSADTRALAPSAAELKSDEVAAVADAVSRAAVRLMISARLDLPAADLSPELSFAIDLGADSLTRVDLVLLLEETLEVSVPDDSMFLVQTVGDAELFATLFDRTREGVVMTLGEAARELTFDTPLSRHGEGASAVACEAAATAIAAEGRLSLPNIGCQTLKDAVRLAFLAVKLREALAGAAGVATSQITDDLVPETGLGLDAAATRQAFDQLTTSMDLGPSPLREGHKLPFRELLQALAELGDDVGGR